MVAVAGLQWPPLTVAGKGGGELTTVQRAAQGQAAPSADTDLWRLDDVRVLETVCYNEITREEYGVFGLQSLSVDCDGEAYWGKAQVQGTMGVSYPDLMQGGQPATFTVEASGSLAKGKNVTVQVETQSRGTRTYLPMILRNKGLPAVPPAGWQTDMPAR